MDLETDRMHPEIESDNTLSSSYKDKDKREESDLSSPKKPSIADNPWEDDDDITLGIKIDNIAQIPGNKTPNKPV